MTPTAQAHSSVRDRAIRLIEEFFAASHGAAARKVIFNRAFESYQPSPVPQIDFDGPLAVFAANVADCLLAFGGVGRGKHALSRLIETMVSERGRQSNPDFHDLPRLLDAQFNIPTRAEQVAYLQRLIDQIEAKARLYSPLSGIKKGAGRPEVQGDAWADSNALALLLRHHSQKRQPEIKLHTREYDDILTAFSEVKQAALLGVPGSGKSTTLRRLALDLARRALDHADEPLPLLVSLGDWLGDEPLPQFLLRKCPEAGWAVEGLARKGRLTLLLDGLNEIPTAERSSKAAEIREFCNELRRLNAKTPVVISCRREDYVGEVDLGIDTLTLEPLTPQRIRVALRTWMENRGDQPETADRLFWQLAGDERLSAVLEKWLAAGSTEESFWSVSSPNEDRLAYSKTSIEDNRLWRDHVPNPRSLVKLASNPFMLTMFFLVWQSEGELPKNRGELFERFAICLLEREGLAYNGQPTSEGKQLIEGLSALAWRMQKNRVAAGQNEEGDFGVLTVVERRIAVETLSSEFLLKKVLECTFLEGSDQFRFRHQLLQEYFSARALRNSLDETLASDLWPPDKWWERSGWEETAVLLAGFFGDDCSQIIRWLARAQPEVAAQCILESGAEIADRPSVLAELQAAWLPRFTDIEREAAPEGRAALGRALGQLGLDNRKGVGLRPDGLPDIDWVEIRGGDFLYQDEERRKEETFSIARYPVTNMQWEAFLDAKDGYADGRWWKGFTNPDRPPVVPAWSESNHPRESVNWHEAIAFCAWLAEKLALDVRLPTEWQWERAARGRDGRTYPWGDDYQSGCANIDERVENAGEHYLGRTSAVGIYPQGASAEGVCDLSGNVWEWCRNEYEHPERTRPKGSESRVLRGGSWYNNQDNARAGSRNDLHPGYRDYYVGFRVVVLSPIRNAGRRATEH